MLRRGAKGYGWYNRFMQHKNDGTLPEKLRELNSFNWLENSTTRPHAYFDITVGRNDVGRLVFELASDVVPNTVAHFAKLCSNQQPLQPSYKGSKIHLINKGRFFMGGDLDTVEHREKSIPLPKNIPDENFIIPHNKKFLLSLASVGVDTGCSQFYVTLKPAPHMDGRCVVFGKLISGEDVISEVEKIYTHRGKPSSDVVITNCGLLENQVKS